MCLFGFVGAIINRPLPLMYEPDVCWRVLPVYSI